MQQREREAEDGLDAFCKDDVVNAEDQSQGEADCDNKSELNACRRFEETNRYENMVMNHWLANMELLTPFLTKCRWSTGNSSSTSRSN